MKINLYPFKDIIEWKKYVVDINEKHQLEYIIVDFLMYFCREGNIDLVGLSDYLFFIMNISKNIKEIKKY